MNPQSPQFQPAPSQISPHQATPHQPASSQISPRGLHHVEIWLPNPADITPPHDWVWPQWPWLFTELGFQLRDEWPGGQSWGIDGTYISLTISPNLRTPTHDRRQPGMNHLVFHGGTREQVDELVAQSPHHGWQPLYQERYPHAGGPNHYAGWLEDIHGYKVEIVASTP